MPAYVVPSVQISQEFTQIPVFTSQPLTALVIGPRYGLFRYGVASEKNSTVVVNDDGVSGNTYQTSNLPSLTSIYPSYSTSDAVYKYPSVPTNSEVDEDYIKVFFESVEAQVFPHSEFTQTAITVVAASVANVSTTSAPSTIDGVSLSSGNLVLLKDQTDKTQNGLYTFLASGSILARHSSYDATGDINFNQEISVSGGTVNSGRKYSLASARVPVIAPTQFNVVAASTANVNVSSAPSSIDGVSLNSGDLVLLKNQTTDTQNGVYVFSSVAGSMSRSTSFDTTGEINPNVEINVLGGPTNIGLKFRSTTTPTIGSSSIVYEESNVLGDQVLFNWGASAVAVGGVNFAGVVMNSSYAGSYANRLIVPGNVKTANNINRSSMFGSRDIKIGDYIEVTDGTNLVRTKVRNLYTQTVAAKNGTVVADANNTGSEVVASNLAIISSATAFTASKDITYVLTVTRAGQAYDPESGDSVNDADHCAKIKITSDGLDGNSIEVLVKSGSTSAENFTVGSYGVVARFTFTNSDDVLELGDKYYIPMYAAGDGVTNIIEVNDVIWSDTDSTRFATTATNVKFRSLISKASVEIPELDISGNATNWTSSEDDITIDKAISITDSSLTNGGELVNLPVNRGKIFVQYRALLKATASTINSLSDASVVESVLGPVTPDNPLAEGVYDALLNSSGVVVYYAGVESNDLAGYNKILALAAKSNKYYSITPLTFDTTIQDAVVAHVNSMSTKENAKWRICWLSRPLVPYTLTYDLKSDATEWKGTITDDPADSVTTNVTLVTIDGASLITDGVRVGDTLRTNFQLSPTGDIVYDSWNIVEVRSETTLIISGGYSSAVTTPIKIQIAHNYTTDEQVANLAASGADYDSRRVRMIFPDTCKTAGVTKNGYFVCAALAGLRSGSAPHQGLTNIQILGFDDFSKTVNDFSQEQLNSLAEAGFWIITQDEIGGTPYTRHQLTTDESSLNYSEDSITTNVDSISFALQKILSAFIGKYNVNPLTLAIISKATKDELNYRMNGTFTSSAGYQLLGYTINKLEQSITFKDKIVLEIGLTLPYPFNYADVTLII